MKEIDESLIKDTENNSAEVSIIGIISIILFTLILLIFNSSWASGTVIVLVNLRLILILLKIPKNSFDFLNTGYIMLVIGIYYAITNMENIKTFDFKIFFYCFYYMIAVAVLEKIVVGKNFKINENNCNSYFEDNLKNNKNFKECNFSFENSINKEIYDESLLFEKRSGTRYNGSMLSNLEYSDKNVSMSRLDVSYIVGGKSPSHYEQFHGWFFQSVFNEEINENRKTVLLYENNIVERIMEGVKYIVGIILASLIFSLSFVCVFQLDYIISLLISICIWGSVFYFNYILEELKMSVFNKTFLTNGFDEDVYSFFSEEILSEIENFIKNEKKKVALSIVGNKLFLAIKDSNNFDSVFNKNELQNLFMQYNKMIRFNEKICDSIITKIQNENKKRERRKKWN